MWYLNAHPLCEIRHHCNGDPATLVDHIIPLEDGGAHYDEDNSQAACDPCHNWKTHAIDVPARQRR